ncbi:MAG: NADH-quinone oxidoreductase subunit H [Chloroflexi bacterium]|nr:NADH-quinone oxidoreductase subunit H [Chloroflexota bacterium]
MSFNIIDFLKSLVSLNVSDYLKSLFGNEPWMDFAADVLGVIIISTFCLLIVIFLIWLERKVIARIQDRIRPNRVGGRYGLLQTVADVIKLLIKENITPAGADKLAYLLAPFLTVMAALLVWAVMPFAPGVIGVDLDIGVFMCWPSVLLQWWLCCWLGGVQIINMRSWALFVRWPNWSVMKCP